MLIPASKRADIANAVNAANEAKKDREILEAASYAIPRAREMFEEGIERSASKGCRSFAECLGECVLLALEEKYGREYPGKYDWKLWFEGYRIDTNRGRFVNDMWGRMIDELLLDLQDNGYETKCKSEYVRYEITAQNLADRKLKVSW